MSTPHARSVPLCDLQIQHRAIEKEIQQAVSRVFASGQVILGPEVAALEHEVAHYCGTGYGIGCASGTDALLLALQALEIGPGDEVLLPPFTFFASAGAVCRAGARPVFVDIDPDTYNLDPSQIESRISGRTRAIMPVHLFGQCADMEPIWRTAERHGLAIIEDAAQAFGAEFQRKKTGSLGAAGCFSFYPSKILGAYGDAGMVVTSDPDWAARMEALRVHGMEVKYQHKYLGWNARLDSVQAAILRVKLPYVEQAIAGRQAAAERYNALIAEFHLESFLERPVARSNCRHVFNQYVVGVSQGQRDALLSHLKADGIGCEVYYPVALHLQECLAYLGYKEGDFPCSEQACKSVLALPMFPELTEEQQARVIRSCAAFAGQRSRLAA